MTRGHEGSTRRRLLAGDIGGTKTTLAIYTAGSLTAPQASPLVLERERSFASKEHGGLEDILRAFLKADGEAVAAAAFGVAGPVVDDAVTTTNLPWHMTASGLRAALGGVPVRLLNDLEATAIGTLFLPAASLLTLNAGVERHGNRAVIAAGTGLGQAFALYHEGGWIPVATEGGHADFAPRDEFEIGLLRFLQRQFPHVSYERLVSGPGLFEIFRFLDATLGRPVAPLVRERLRREDPSAVIGDLALADGCPTCVEAVERFVSLYGAQAGNLALTVMALGGVYVGGGIVTKLEPKITAGEFMRAFTAKGRYAALMAEIPVKLILDPKAALLGAAHAALASGAAPMTPPPP